MFRKRLLIALGITFSAVVGCNDRPVRVISGGGDAGADLLADSPSAVVETGASDQSNTIGPLPDAGPLSDAGPLPVATDACTVIACDQTGGRYCGKIGDGCGGVLDCGDCPNGMICGSVSPNICGGAAACQPLTCASAGGRYCGKIGDGCGRLLDCGDCPAGQTCGLTTDHECGAPPPAGCKPLTCDAATGRYCGKIGDGCGGIIDCGDCPGGGVCGGGGIPSVCAGGTSCQPVTCAPASGQYCDKISDGCGRMLDCGGCPSGGRCGATIQNVCTAPASCTPIACVSGSIHYCGEIGDGCGNPLDCGDCPAGQTCGGRGVTHVCAGGNCTPLTCSSANGRYCGVIGDGCGGSLDCGACPAGTTCGGGGTAHICSGPPPTPPPGCRPVACSVAGGQYCGVIGDGCGGSLDCGSCPSAMTCAGGGVSSVCGAPAPVGCQPGSCTTAAARFCGLIGDGCGHSLDCGNCPAGQDCGAAGTANVCAPTNCTPISCQQANGKYCGLIGDGCGHSLDCGGCTGPDTCGGGGITDVCGHDTCVNLCKRQTTCAGGASTTVTGTVLAPTPPKFGAPDPIYNAIVYVPNAPVAPFSAGVSCQQCGEQVSGTPLVQALTGADGTFALTNMPSGDNVPLVIQLGRWRRQVVIPHIEPCQTTTLPPELTRLPRNKSEGDIPLMAMDTGKVDTLECVLRKIGIDDAEFTLPAGNGRVRIYQADSAGGGATLGPGTPQANALTGDAAALSQYDMVLLACEGAQIRINKPAASQMRLVDYANAGGRIFATHYSYAWLDQNAPFQGTAMWNVDQPHPQPDPLPGTVDQSFAKGVAFAKWLQLVGASPTPGQINIGTPRHDLDGVNPPSQRWIYSINPATVQHYTFNTPVGTPADQQCGRVLFSDFHVNNVVSSQNIVFPQECANTPLTPQEKVLEFMLFDLASCVQPDTLPPPLPMPPASPPSAPPSAPPPAPPAAPPPGPAAPPPAPSTPPPTPPSAPPPPPTPPPAPASPPPAPPPPPPSPPPQPPPVVP